MRGVTSSSAGPLRGAARVLGARPGRALLLGAAAALSFAALGCGIGWVAAPWLTCEMIALALGARSAERQAGPRLRASAVIAVTVFVVGMSAVLAGLALGLGAAVVTVLVGALAAAPVAWAPACLIEHNGTTGAALAEAASRAAADGPTRARERVLSATLVAFGPAALALALSLRVGGESTVALAIGVLATGLLLSLCLPVAVAWVTLAYAASRAPGHAGTGSPIGAPRLVTTAATVTLIAVIAGLLLLGRPTPAPVGSAPPGGRLADLTVGPASPRTLHTVPGGPVVYASRHRVSVAMADGGGSGEIPVPARPIDQVRLVWSGTPRPPARADAPSAKTDRWAVEIRAGGRRFTTQVDGEGVRLDDDLTRRARVWLLPAPLAALLAQLAAAVLLVGPALSGPRRRARAFALSFVAIAAVALVVVLLAF